MKSFKLWFRAAAVDGELRRAVVLQGMTLEAVLMDVPDVRRELDLPPHRWELIDWEPA